MANKKIDDDKYNIIKNDIQRIRMRPSMYIASLGDTGVFHLCKELIDNNRDECIKKHSPGNTILVNITDKKITTSDNGRGIPTKLLRVVLETIQAGSNMTRSDHDATSGENGVGTTCILAMSSYLEAISLRPQEKKKLTLRYKNTELVDEILEDYNGSEHGLTMTFKPSKKILGTDIIPIDMLKEWLADFDYTLPKSIKMQYIINGEGRNVKHKETIEYFDDIIPYDNRLFDGLTIKCDGKMTEEIQYVKYDRHFSVDASIVYSNGDYKGDDIRHSWMNMIHTSQNGSHVNGVINGLYKYISEKCCKKNKKFEDEDLKKDILMHLHVVVKAECDFAHMFSSQAKHTVFSKQIGNSISKAVYETLSSMPQSKINDIVDIVIGNNRVRLEGEKMRNISSTARMSKSWTKPKAYIPCSTIKTPQPKELFLVEGNSAGGGIRGARDTMYQAILTFRGKSLNVWDEDIDRVLKSGPWLNLVHVLGCGVGPTFDLKKCNFDKIIIATDADIDGYHIRVGFCAFFLKFMPEIIENGMLYISEPPLYKLMKDKEVSYVASQQEYVHKCISSLSEIKIISFTK